LRTEGKSYLEIAQQGGGIIETVRSTRVATLQELVDSLTIRSENLLKEGITTCEVKSGYGLNMEDELKMLQAINWVNNTHKMDLIPTALCAHVSPPEFKSADDYISFCCDQLLPEIKKLGLANRVDIFIEQGAFNYSQGKKYIKKALSLGFSITIHADQFSTDGSKLAAEYGAISADHLEASTDEEIEILAKNKIVGTVLPGASIGLGIPFAPARKMIDSGMTVAIASDWNPGSAPMGDLLLQASVLGVYEKLSLAETLAGITRNAAKALNLKNIGILEAGKKADMVAFPFHDYREIFWKQGKVKPFAVWKDGEKI